MQRNKNTRSSDTYSNSIPDGFVFFTPQTNDRHKTRRKTFIIIVLVVTLALVWPVYSISGDLYPFVLGVPFSFAWVIGCLLVVFGALIWLYRTEEL